ncbi:MAG TPA: class I SAM-dependent methyltransferase [Planctomycetota bacterium]|nr:class I SAM-dependent methyltransferase [Planctomycetota bacterium]
MDYDESQHRTYEAGRRLSPATVTLWMDALGEFLPDERRDRLTILDLGCGTGRFSVPLAGHFGAHVIGVEPSGEMRRKAEANATHPRVMYLEGYAEEIPCEDASCDAAFMSQAVHHFGSIPDACRELYRVLRPDATVFVRNCFRDRLNAIPWYDFFPAAKEIDNRRLPDVDELTRTFASAGFERVALRAVVQELDPSLRALHERLKLRSLSTFELMTEEQITDGLEALKQAALAEREPKPVREAIDLLVFRRGELKWPD